MRVEFTGPNSGAPVRLLAEAEIYFDDMAVGPGGHALPSPLAGTKLVGFKVWKGEHETYVTVPGRSFGAGEDRAYYDYVRPADANANGPRAPSMVRLKRWIAEQYELWRKQRSPATPEEE